MEGIEPSSLVCQTSTLPLNYIPLSIFKYTCTALTMRCAFSYEFVAVAILRTTSSNLNPNSSAYMALWMHQSKCVMVERKGVEPSFPACYTDVFPLDDHPYWVPPATPR